MIPEEHFLFDKKQLDKFRKKLQSHPTPWQGAHKYGKSHGDVVSLYQIRDANGVFVLNLEDPQEAHELVMMANAKSDE